MERRTAVIDRLKLHRLYLMLRAISPSAMMENSLVYVWWGVRPSDAHIYSEA